MEIREENLTEDTLAATVIVENAEPVKEKLLIRVGKKILAILILAVIGFVLFLIVGNLNLWGSHPG